MTDSEGNVSSQDEKSYQYLPERQAKMVTLLNMIKKVDKDSKMEDAADPIYYCICRSTDGTRFMICCDYCEQWYHGDCMNIERETSKNIKRYACPPCQEKNPNAKILYREKRTDPSKERVTLKDKIRIKKEREEALRKKRRKKKHRLEMEKMKKKRAKEKNKMKAKKIFKRIPLSSSSDQDSRKTTGAAAQRHARRCGQCDACQVQNDCGSCDFCLDMRKYGGQNKLRQKCRAKQCTRLASRVLKYKNLKLLKRSGSDHKPRITTTVDSDSETTQGSMTDRSNRHSSTVDISLLDHYDYALRPELDPSVDRSNDRSKDKKTDKDNKDKKDKQPEVKERTKVKDKETAKDKRPTKEERKRKRSQQTIDEEPKYKRVLRSSTAVTEDVAQCYGPGCVNTARQGSKYCSEACGLKLATNRLFEFLPQRIQQWQNSPCIAEEKNKKSLEKMRNEMEEAKRQIAELDSKIVKLNKLVDRAKKAQVAHGQENADGDNEEADLSIFCVSCGHPVNPSRALRHMTRCYSKYESKTSFGSAFKTKIVGESMFCDYFNSQQNTYCKRLKVLCPEHTKEQKLSPDEVCGCPLVADVFQETKGFCRIAKRTCTKHYNWEKLRRAEIDLGRVRWWLKLDELLEQERNVRQAMFNRAGVLGLMLHQTLDHSLLMPQAVPPSAQEPKSEDMP